MPINDCYRNADSETIEREFIKLDAKTKKWMNLRAGLGLQITLAKCLKCNLFYNPELGHRCKGNAKYASEK